MLKEQFLLFFSIVTVATPCWGFGTQHGLIFSRFWYLAFCYYSSDPSFLLFKAEFTLLSRAPNSLGSDSSAVSSLCVFMDTRIFLGNFYVFGLVGTFIKTNFVFRYARYAIKSDYSNLIFNLCLRFLSWRHFLQQNSLNSIFFVLALFISYFTRNSGKFDELRVSQ